MYSRYVANKLLIAHKSWLLQKRWCGVAHCPIGLGSLRTFSESVVFLRYDRRVLIGRTLNLNCALNRQIVLSNSGLPAPIKTLRMILIFQLEISRLMSICWHKFF